MCNTTIIIAWYVICMSSVYTSLNVAYLISATVSAETFKASHRAVAYGLVMIRYIENSDISFSISIYRIVSYRQKNSKFWIYRYTLCFKKTGTLFLSLIGQSSGDQFT